MDEYEYDPCEDCIEYGDHVIYVEETDSFEYRCDKCPLNKDFEAD